MRFSQRRGLTPVAQGVQTEAMNDELRNSLWSVLDTLVWSRQGFTFQPYGVADIEPFSKALWFQLFKQPTDTIPESGHDILSRIRDVFFHWKWYEVYDFIEWTLNHLQNEALIGAVNSVLERELAGYRFVSGVLTDTTDQQEVKLLDEALSDKTFKGVQKHLQTALQHLSNRQKPDYRNSIKESISAVESMAQVISGNSKATLGDALSALAKRGDLHPALRNGFASLYGYTSSEGGIRHAMLEEPNLSAADAKFFLLSCTSFINYLKSKM